jgi:uncharacterized membrane protein
MYIFVWLIEVNSPPTECNFIRTHASQKKKFNWDVLHVIALIVVIVVVLVVVIVVELVVVFVVSVVLAVVPVVLVVLLSVLVPRDPWIMTHFYIGAEMSFQSCLLRVGWWNKSTYW